MRQEQAVGMSSSLFNRDFFFILSCQIWWDRLYRKETKGFFHFYVDETPIYS